MTTLPSLNCDSDDYKAVYPFFVTLVAVFSVGLPIGLLVFLLWAWKTNRLFTSKYRERYGTLHEVYQPKFFFYEVLVLAR